ncbi:MAG: LysM peptidoglycan-binding domain-containing protein [Chloroflexota bacterium]
MKYYRTIFLSILSSALLTVVIAPLPAQAQNDQTHIVESGDTLSRLAEQYYGDLSAWNIIVEATNAKAEEDDSFTVIDNPDLIEVGQKLWIPNQPDTATDVSEVVADVGEDAEKATEEEKPLTKDDLPPAYLKALDDAEVAEADEISKDLIAIVEPNDLSCPEDSAGRLQLADGTLCWRNSEAGPQVLVSTWGHNRKNYDTRNVLGDDERVWVTAVPEFQRFCTNYQGEVEFTLRLAQRLGLHPKDADPNDDGFKTQIFELWVSPLDLYRPSPDPEISDREAELDFPSSPYFTIAAEYQTWFEDNKQNSFHSDNVRYLYPWTGLGYTYDWGDEESEVGFSEFIIRPGASYVFARVAPTNEYCGRR